MPFPQRCTLAVIFCAALLSTSCIRRQFDSLPPMYINLYSGIADVAYLGEHESQVLGRKWRFKEVAVPSDALATALGVEKIVEMPEIGVKVYFRRQLVTLIEIQDPFPGYLLGRNDPLFSFSLARQDSWREDLIRQLGKPVQEATGGRLGSHALFYRWGDIAFNRMGPNQVALYRLPDVIPYREKNFGRVIKFFTGQ
ncbi:MAG: hypothetical protein KDD51_10300 [Bdellovibrionales bacterium]|nr:hypothetical protein [Bdellovibrionales bacterium]